MKRIAVEEAFSVPGIGKKLGVGPGSTASAPEAVRYWSSRLPDLGELRLEEMDKYGIDVQVLSLAAPGIQSIADTASAVRDAKAANDILAGAVAQHPTRFAGLAALPLQEPDEAASELERAVTELGLRGALVNGHTMGRYLDEDRFKVIWERLEAFNAPLYLHPGAPPQDSWQVVEDYPELNGATWKWGAETAGHALRIVYGGVFDDFPRATLILGHMGEFLPFQFARFDSRYGLIEVRRRLEHLPSEYFATNIMITTSGVCSHAALLGAILAMGVDRVMFAVDYPFAHPDAAVKFIDSAPLAPADLAKVAHGNAERVFRL